MADSKAPGKNRDAERVAHLEQLKKNHDANLKRKEALPADNPHRADAIALTKAKIDQVEEELRETKKQ